MVEVFLAACGDSRCLRRAGLQPGHKVAKSDRLQPLKLSFRSRFSRAIPTSRRAERFRFESRKSPAKIFPSSVGG
jgi:hypothetical protein